MEVDPDQVKYAAEETKSAIDALAEIADEDSLKVLKLIDRLLADDYTGCGVYEAVDAALKHAEGAADAVAE